MLLYGYEENGEAMCSFAGFILLVNLLLVFLLDKLPDRPQKWLKNILLVVFFVPFVIEGVVVYNYTALIGVGVVASLLETNLKEAGEFITMYAGPQEIAGVIALLCILALLALNKPWRKLHFDAVGKRCLPPAFWRYP